MKLLWGAIALVGWTACLTVWAFYAWRATHYKDRSALPPMFGCCGGMWVFSWVWWVVVV
jgi:hypothetical protein